MTNKKIGFFFVFGFLIILSLNISAQQNRNSITGMVYDSSNNRPLSDVFVELTNDVYSTLGRRKTDSSGRFSFNGLSSGSFKVKVLSFGTNYLEETKDVEIVVVRLGNSSTMDNVYVDFYLRLDKRKININEQVNATSIFVQDIPILALETYKLAITQLKNPLEVEQGIQNLKKAIEIYPEYYDSQLRLGVEFTNQNKFYDAIPHLIKAVTINKKSFLGFYSLGISAFNLKQYVETEKAFETATFINPQSDYANIQYGMILRVNSKYKEAEIVLLKAKSITKTSPNSQVHWQLALLFEKTGRKKQAADELELFLKVEPNPQNLKQIKELISRLRKEI